MLSSPPASTCSKVSNRDNPPPQALVHLVGVPETASPRRQHFDVQRIKKLRNRFTRSLHKLFTSVRPNYALALNPFKQPDLTASALRTHCEQPANSPRQWIQRTDRERSDPPRGADPPTRKRRIAPSVFATIRHAAITSPKTATNANTTKPRTTHSGHQRRSSCRTLPRIDFQAGSGPGTCGAGGGLPSISRTSASIVSGTARSLADPRGRSIRSSGGSWKRLKPGPPRSPRRDRFQTRGERNTGLMAQAGCSGEQLIALCPRRHANYLLDRQIRSLERSSLQIRGFRER